jgi:carbamate kinase
MKIVIARGGNALLRRGDPMTTEVQRRSIRIAAEAIAPLAAGREDAVMQAHDEPALGWTLVLRRQPVHLVEGRPKPIPAANGTRQRTGSADGKTG